MEIQPLIYDSTLKALTVRAPWAWAIMAGLKRVENRSWKSSFRGCVAIHAGCSPDSDADAATVFNELQIKSPPNLIRGAIIGLVDLVDILPLDEYLRQYGNDS
ncbi:MAG: ASCH domain-containing protein, partial [Thermoguttaceae bacterium]|nr:ASCH domain-containing protein [Thermoguttaceae bacterium]